MRPPTKAAFQGAFLLPIGPILVSVAKCVDFAWGRVSYADELGVKLALCG